MFKSALPLASLALAGCATTAAQPLPTEMPLAPEGSNGWQAAGETSRFGPWITPIRVIEDSRCPVNARCVWAGRVVVETQLSLRNGTDRRKVAMTLGEPVAIADGSARLVAVWQDRFTGSEIAPGDYRFAYRFDGGL